MKTDLNFSYPVLGANNDITPLPNIQSPIIIEDENSKDYDIQFEFDYDNDDIKKLVKEGKAIYCCEVECTHTLFRKRYYSASPVLNCSVRRSEVGKDIGLTFTIVAKSDIPGYSNTNCHPDYNGYKFDLSMGDILGLFGQFKFFANLKANQFNATSDFLSIEKVDDDIIPCFDFNGDKVVLKLPYNQYDIFYELRDNPAHEEILMSTFALQAVTEAIHAISNPDNPYKSANRKWVEALSNRIEAIPECANMDLDTDAYKIAQLIMRDDQGKQPFERMLTKLKIR